MDIRSERRRGRPIYRQCGSQVISYIPERVVWELHLPGMKRATLRLIERAVYVIDEAGVRRVRQGLAVRLGRVRSR
jgi:hypothetical protein